MSSCTRDLSKLSPNFKYIVRFVTRSTQSIAHPAHLVLRLNHFSAGIPRTPCVTASCIACTGARSTRPRRFRLFRHVP
jgi:hypothetical protein